MATIGEFFKKLGIGGTPGERRLHSREEAIRTNSLSSIRGGGTPDKVAPRPEMRNRFPVQGTQSQASLQSPQPRFPIMGTQAQAQPGLFTQAPQPETRSSIIDKQLQEITTGVVPPVGLMGQNGADFSVDQTMAIVPGYLSPWRENQLRIEENIRQEEEAGRPFDLGLFNAKQRYQYDTNLEKARVERDSLLEGNISLDRQENEERRMLSQAASEQERRNLFDYGSNDMASREQLQNKINIDPVVLEVGDTPTDKEVLNTLLGDYQELVDAGAHPSAFTQLNREIDALKKKINPETQGAKFPSFISEAGASDVVDTSTAGVTGNIWTDTPPATFSNVQEFTGQEAIDQVEATYGPLNELQKFLVEKEGYRPGWYEDTVGVATAGVGQTGEYAAMTPIEAMNAKINETKAKVTVFDDLDLDEQKAVIDANYRGDVYNGWKNKYIAYINERTSDPKSDTLPSLKQEAYEELWNNNEYVLMMGRLQANKSVDGDNGVMKRVKKWMKTLFKDDQPTADAQAKIDAHAATL